MNKKMIVILLSIVSIFFLTAQTCSVGTTASGLAADCEGEGDILCNDDGEAYECALASYGTGYYTSRASEYDEEYCGTEEVAAEDDADGDGVADEDDICEGYDDADDTDGDGTPDGCDLLTDSDSDGVADTDDICADEDDTVDYDADEIPDCIDDEVIVADCSDTDSGSDYYAAGVVTYDDGSGEVEYTESCEAGYDYTGTLTEYSCNDYGELLTETVSCEYGCADDYASCATEIPVDTTTDTDGDGLSDYDEETTYTYGTYIDDADSDDDGLTDGEEVLATYTYHSDPMDADSDDDTLSDYEEVLEGDDGYISDPNNPDTNDDEIGDLIEVTFGINPQESTMEDYVFFDLTGESATAVYTGDDGTLTGSVDEYTSDDGAYYYLDGSDYFTLDIANALAGAQRIIVVTHILPDGEQTATVFGQNAKADTCDTSILPFSFGVAGSEYSFTITTDATTETIQGGTVGDWALLTGIWYADSETMSFYIDNEFVGEATGVTGSLLGGGTIQFGTSACGDVFTGSLSQAKIWWAS